MVGTVSTTPASRPAALASPITACRAMTWPLMPGEISLPNSTVKAVSPQERYRTLTSARIAPRIEGVCHGDDERWTGQHQFRSRRELRALGDGQRRRDTEGRAIGQPRLWLPCQRPGGDDGYGEALRPERRLDRRPSRLRRPAGLRPAGDQPLGQGDRGQHRLPDRRPPGDRGAAWRQGHAHEAAW